MCTMTHCQWVRPVLGHDVEWTLCWVYPPVAHNVQALWALWQWALWYEHMVSISYHSAHFTLKSAHFTLKSAHFTLKSAYFTLHYSFHSETCSFHSSPLISLWNVLIWRYRARMRVVIALWALCFIIVHSTVSTVILIIVHSTVSTVIPLWALCVITVIVLTVHSDNVCIRVLISDHEHSDTSSIPRINLVS